LFGSAPSAGIGGGGFGLFGSSPAPVKASTPGGFTFGTATSSQNTHSRGGQNGNPGA
jgi:hypothetical protein